MDKSQLVNLCARTWSLTALSLIANGVSARVSPLAAAAGCGRTAMGASVEHLLHLGLLQRNPGHGHPLRPEYQLTLEGECLAEWSARLSSLAKGEADKALLRNKWSLALLSCLPEERRYSDLRRALVPVTDRALSVCLNNLTENAWLKRRVSHSVTPPTVSYRTILLGKKIHDHVLTLPEISL